MNLEELKTNLKAQHYHYQYDEQEAYHVISNADHEIVAIINALEDNVFVVVKKIPVNILIETIMHFARTPIEARADNDYINIQLTANEYQQLKEFKTNLKWNDDHWKVTSGQLQALKALQKQVNRQYHLIGKAQRKPNVKDSILKLQKYTSGD